MKTFKLIGMTLLVVSLCIGFYSCGGDEVNSKEPEITTPEITIGADTKLDFTASKEVKNLSFSTNTDWTITVSNSLNDENWCTITPASGKAGNNTV